MICHQRSIEIVEIKRIIGHLYLHQTDRLMWKIIAQSVKEKLLFILIF